MFKDDSKEEFIDKVIEYGIGVNLTSYKIDLLCLDLVNCISEYSYYTSRISGKGLVEIKNTEDTVCELEVGDLGIFFVKYEDEMARGLVPVITKFFAEKTFA
jgi:hypothetical protein